MNPLGNAKFDPGEGVRFTSEGLQSRQVHEEEMIGHFGEIWIRGKHPSDFDLCLSVMDQNGKDGAFLDLEAFRKGLSHQRAVSSSQQRFFSSESALPFAPGISPRSGRIVTNRIGSVLKSDEVCPDKAQERAIGFIGEGTGDLEDRKDLGRRTSQLLPDSPQFLDRQPPRPRSQDKIALPRDRLREESKATHSCLVRKAHREKDRDSQ